jgi:cysteine protease ATG4
MEVLRPPEDTMFDSQMTEVPIQTDVSRDKEKKSKSRGLAKKTSQLFSRSSSKDKGAEGDHGGSSASLRLPNSSRQTSYSSAGSIDSASSTSSSFRHPMAGLHRPPSNQSQDRSPKSNHSRRLSQDSGTSWTGQPRSIRSGSSSAFTSPTESNHLPIPSRQNSQLSASVPSLSRQGLPQPAPGQDAGGNFPSRMSTWFSHLIPSASTASVPAPAPQLSSSASPRKPTSAAASFLNAARQRAVDGVRHLLDSEAQPDKCPDPMWVMGVAHPGWRPDTPIDLNGSPSSSIARSGNDNVSESDPPLRSGEPDPSDTVRPKRKDNLPISPPAKGFGNLFSASTLSLALPASITQGSPSKDTENRSASPMESPSKQRRGKEKEVLKWPENCKCSVGILNNI